MAIKNSLFLSLGKRKDLANPLGLRGLAEPKVLQGKLEEKEREPLTLKSHILLSTIKRILVTGSSGTIGTRLCEMLVEKGYDVTGADINENKWNKLINSKTIIVDLRDINAIEKLGNDFDLVVHLAANARVYDLVLEPEKALDNITMLFNTLEFCRINGIKKFFFASSREVYGNAGKAKYREYYADIEHCESPYAASKITGEAMVRAYNACYGIEFIVARFSNVYGMYDDSDRVIPLFIRKTIAGEDLEVFGKGKKLDFTYIDDTIDGIVKCIGKFETAKNETYNIASGNGESITVLAKEIIKRLGGKNKIIMGQNRKGEVVQFIGNIDKAGKKIGYSPKTSLDDGLSKSIKWYKDLYGKAISLHQKP